MRRKCLFSIYVSKPDLATFVDNPFNEFYETQSYQGFFSDHIHGIE
jgi:hypothetical protein